MKIKDLVLKEPVQCFVYEEEDDVVAMREWLKKVSDITYDVVKFVSIPIGTMIELESTFFEKKLIVRPLEVIVCVFGMVIVCSASDVKEYCDEKETKE